MNKELGCSLIRAMLLSLVVWVLVRHFFMRPPEFALVIAAIATASFAIGGLSAKSYFTFAAGAVVAMSILGIKVYISYGYQPLALLGAGILVLVLGQIKGFYMAVFTISALIVSGGFLFLVFTKTVAGSAIMLTGAFVILVLGWFFGEE